MQYSYLSFQRLLTRSLIEVALLFATFSKSEFDVDGDIDFVVSSSDTGARAPRDSLSFATVAYTVETRLKCFIVIIKQLYSIVKLSLFH